MQYVIARRGESDKMLTMLGTPGDTPGKVVVSELTTIASTWTSSQFLEGDTISGNDVGLVAAARNVPNLVDVETGRLGDVVQNTTNGLRTNTLATMNSLASMLSDCLTDGCADTLFVDSAPAGVAVPTGTLAAFHNIALNPWHNVDTIFSRLQPGADGNPDNPTYMPTLLWPPTAWTLSLVYTDGGFNAPGGMSIDREGSLWTNNNFMPGSQSVLLDAGGVLVPDPLAYSGTGITKLASNGEAKSPQTGILGGGTFGGAFGVAIDMNDDVWFGNFAGDSVSKFDSDGEPISPDSTSAYASDGGWHYSLDGESGFHSPQSTIVTTDNSVWVSNIQGNTVSQLVGGDPDNIRTWGADPSCANVFSNPWGLASDGDNNVWVADFFGKRIHNLCGASGSCPEGMQGIGDRISPPGRADSPEAGMGGGYGANAAIQSITSIVVDQAGNVWAANNFDNVTVCLEGAGIPPTGESTTVGLEKLQTQFGGNRAVVVFGVAAPVAAPLIGPPRQP